ncbi:MAG: glycerophosphodiester phosphodiesterase [Ardenticatenaceae bacterium]|nr:glycerophosphodiester phosphodiesterase [Ardenticatenaceae bacterium]
MRQKIGRILIGLLVIAGCVYLFFVIRARPVADHPFFAGQSGPMVIAHQGGEELRPSNTMIAFQHAVDLGVDVLEMDIHMTQDGVIVVMHDATVDRTTDGSGAIQEMTFAEIETLDAGYYWTDDDGATYPYRGQGIRVPALAEVLQAFPDMPFNIEIKQAEPSIVVPFCDLLREYGMAEQVLVPSFDAETIAAMRATCPEVATSLVRPEVTQFWILNVLGLSAAFRAPGEAIQVPERSTLPVLGEVQVVTERFVRNAHRHHVAVHVWTIDETDDMARLLDLGVDGLITDRPDRMLTLLER